MKKLTAPENEDPQFLLELPITAARTEEFVAVERGRGWAFKNEEGRYLRLDVLDLLLSKGQISECQHQAGKRYQRQYAAAYEYGRLISTLEFLTEPRALDNAIQSALWLGQAQRQALGADRRLVGAVDHICERPLAAKDLVFLRVALSRLSNYYADLEDESEEIDAPPTRRTLADRGAEVSANWGSSHSVRTSAGRRTKDDLKRLLWEAQNKRCACCGAVLPDPDGAEVDHVWPIHRGGADEPGNFTLTHVLCNRRKRQAKPRRYELDVLAAVNEVLGWAQPDVPVPAEERIAKALERAANPAPAPTAKPRHIHIPRAAPVAVPPPHLEKPSRHDGSMHERWLASQGVLRSNRTMRARGVNAGSRRK